MPQRQRVKQIKSEEVQGADSWVKIRKPTVGEARELLGNTELGAKFQQVVLAWNWVDDNGDPLPQPSEVPDITDLLTADEITFINGALTGTTKN